MYFWIAGERSDLFWPRERAFSLSAFFSSPRFFFYMNLLYADESGSVVDPNQTYFILAGGFAN
jgi:hypothetical protein